MNGTLKQQKRTHEWSSHPLSMCRSSEQRDWGEPAANSVRSHARSPSCHCAHSLVSVCIRISYTAHDRLVCASQAARFPRLVASAGARWGDPPEGASPYPHLPNPPAPPSTVWFQTCQHWSVMPGHSSGSRSILTSASGAGGLWVTESSEAAGWRRSALVIRLEVEGLKSHPPHKQPVLNRHS